MHGLIYIHRFPSFVQRESLETVKHTSVAKSTPSTQILASNTQYHSPIKEIRILGETADSRAGAGNIQHEPETSYSDRKKRL